MSIDAMNALLRQISDQAYRIGGLEFAIRQAVRDLRSLAEPDDEGKVSQNFGLLLYGSLQVAEQLEKEL